MPLFARSSGLFAALVVAMVAAISVGCADETTAGPGADKDASAAATPSGLGKACVTNNDCEAYDLTCYLTGGAGASRNTGICSKGCDKESDCGGGTHCNPLGGILYCAPPQLCDTCKTDDDCGPDAPLCVGDDGAKYCSRLCNVGDGKCPGGYSCKQFGTRVDEFACAPDYGSCAGDGSHCSPCKTDSQCSTGTKCFSAKEGAERFCAQTCDVATTPDGCPVGHKCASYGGVGYCYKHIATDANGKDVLLPTCIAASKGYCDACESDWQCASGRCATKNDKKFCAQIGTCTKQTEKEDCPYATQDATFCVPSNKGQICAPSPAFNCHGYKACLSHPCGADERCDDGLCKKVN